MATLSRNLAWYCNVFSERLAHPSCFYPCSCSLPSSALLVSSLELSDTKVDFGSNLNPKPLKIFLLLKRYAGTGTAPPKRGREGGSLLHYSITAKGVVAFGLPPSSAYGTYKTVKARCWPLLEPFCRQTHLKPFYLFHPRSTACAPQKVLDLKPEPQIPEEVKV